MKLHELHETTEPVFVETEDNPFSEAMRDYMARHRNSKSINCVGRDLTSLEGAPKSIDEFFCSANPRLKNLKGGPTTVGYFNCSDCSGLTSLEGAPKVVKKYFDCCDNTKLKSLKGGPEKVHGFRVLRCGLTSLEGAPREIDYDFNVDGNQLTNLRNIHRLIKRIGNRAFFNNNPITSHVLGLLLIKDLAFVELDNTPVQSIINKYLGQARRANTEPDVIACQDELIDAGFAEYAEL